MIKKIFTHNWEKNATKKVEVFSNFKISKVALSDLQ
jgi:hypothetical protein